MAGKLGPDVLENGSPSAPLYRKIEDALRDLIHSAEYEPGDKIPSERDLAEQLEVSRMTVRKAVDNLVSDGLLERDSTSGTRVRAPQVRRRISGATEGVSQLLSDAGAEPGSRLLFFEERTATNKMAQRLSIQPGDTLIVVKRLRTTNGEAFCVETSYFPKVRVPDLMAADVMEAKSLYGLLKDRYGIVPATGEQNLSVAQARDEEARLLGIPPGSPVLLQRATVYDTTGRAMEYVKSANHPELVAFTSNNRL